MSYKVRNFNQNTRKIQTSNKRQHNMIVTVVVAKNERGVIVIIMILNSKFKVEFIV